MGSVKTVKSKYYSDKVMDATSGAHFDHETGEVERALDDSKIVTEDVNEARQAGIGFFVFVALLGLSCALVNQVHAAFLPAYGALCAIMGHVLPVMRAVPYFSDDDEDWLLAGGMTLLFGPLVGAIAYGVVGFIRQGSWNPAVVALFIVGLATRIAFEIASGAGVEMFQKMMPMNDSTGVGFAKQWMLLAGLFGWIAADYWKRADE